MRQGPTSALYLVSSVGWKTKEYSKWLINRIKAANRTSKAVKVDNRAVNKTRSPVSRRRSPVRADSRVVKVVASRAGKADRTAKLFS